MGSEPRRYNVSLKPAAERALAKLSKRNQKTIASRIEALALTPRPRGAEKLKGAVDLYRIRSGDFRIIYQVQGDVLRVLVVIIGDRKDIYDRLKRLFG